MCENRILSYSGSGNHLVRFFIELLSERPTLGWNFVKEDVAIYKATFAEPVPFSIKEDAPPIYQKEHHPPSEKNIKRLIVIARNPREVIVRQAGLNLKNLLDGMFINTTIVEQHLAYYFEIINYYINFKGEKLLLFYEDLISKKQEFVQQLYNFLEVDNSEKLEYALENVDKLYLLSKTGKNRSWLGAKSDGSASFYYKKLYSTVYFESILDMYFSNPIYKFMKEKYHS